MKSCAEAMYYLKECGAAKLDRDGDGIPCEKLCK
ncbi:MAG: excalibur calcium-binding domain-containing protein [Methyloglobulus sp.]|nr:excalibur calcium-binding domain-containing protein [Methyloglobulus sp.]